MIEGEKPYAKRHCPDGVLPAGDNARFSLALDKQRLGEIPGISAIPKQGESGALETPFLANARNSTGINISRFKLRRSSRVQSYLPVTTKAWILDIVQ